MDILLDQEENRIVKIRAKNSKKKPVAAVSSKKKKKKVPKMKNRKKEPTKSDVVRSTPTKSDVKGIKVKAELGDNLESKKVGSSKQLPKVEKRLPVKNPTNVNYLRVKNDMSSATLSPLAFELATDPVLLKIDVAPVIGKIADFMRSPNLEQGVILI